MFSVKTFLVVWGFICLCHLGPLCNLKMSYDADIVVGTFLAFCVVKGYISVGRKENQLPFNFLPEAAKTD